jgi:pentatricopeptide repeat protein
VDAMKLIRTLDTSSLNLGIDTYNCVLDGLCKEGELDLASELFWKLSHKGLVSNVVTYTIPIHGFSK